MAGQDIIEVIPRKYRPLLEQSLRGRWQTLQEVRFRIGQAVEWYDGKKHRIDATRVTRMDMKEMMDYMSGYSLYAFEDEIAKGYLTIPGGHRVGVAGQVVVEEEKVKYIQNISFANIRISHEKIGCADKILPYLWQENRIKNTLIIAPPRCGKTTILRDLTRKISGEYAKKNVVVVDERSEIAGCYRGEPQKDVGPRTDVLDRCPKAVGMMMAVRSLSPEVLVVDEIGGKQDILALQEVLKCGCSVIATAHGEKWEEWKRRPDMQELFEKRYFECYILLQQGETPGQIASVREAGGVECYDI